MRRWLCADATWGVIRAESHGRPKHQWTILGLDTRLVVEIDSHVMLDYTLSTIFGCID